MSNRNRQGFWSLCHEEPFRIFFPLGLLVGISGVSLWPLYFTGIHKFYPGVMHGRMMIQGFMTAFIIGFLGTAFPRLSGTFPLRRGELWTLLVLLLAVVGVQIGKQPQIGDGLFLLLLVFFVSCLIRRVRRRKEPPPPGFVLVAFGFLHALLGTTALIVGAWRVDAMRLGLLGNLLLYQGFVLCLLLGVGGFLLPRFLGLLAGKDDAGTDGDSNWHQKATRALLVGVVMFTSFLFEAWSGGHPVAGLVRAGVAVVYLLSQVPFWRGGVPRVSLAQSLRLGFVLLLIGLFLPTLWPMQRVGALHLVFIGGFTLITFCVATRVVLGHSGQGRRVTERLPFLLVTVVLLLVGAALRVWGDFLPSQRGTILNTASYLWMLAASVWGWRLLPAVRIADSAS